MRNISLAFLVSAAIAVPSAAFAQDKAKTADDYLCQFAGKCGDSAEEEITKDAPATKGFSLTRPGASKAAPATKGFSLNKPTAAKAAPATQAAKAPAPARMTAPAKPARQLASKSISKKSMAPAKSIPAVAGEKRGDLSLSFELGSAVLTATARDNARAFAEALKQPELAAKRIVIEGHTDAQGSREYNLELSKRRAQAVADYLGELGVSRDRLDVKGFGFDRPLRGRSAASGDNRRVEAVLTS